MKKRLTKLDKIMIRLAIWTRQGGECLWCGKNLTLDQMHCHEKIHRGKGGVMSLENSIGLCFDCHINGAHGDRQVRPSGMKKVLDKRPEIA